MATFDAPLVKLGQDIRGVVDVSASSNTATRELIQTFNLYLQQPDTIRPATPDPSQLRELADVLLRNGEQLERLGRSAATTVDELRFARRDGIAARWIAIGGIIVAMASLIVAIVK